MKDIKNWLDNLERQECPFPNIYSKYFKEIRELLEREEAIRSFARRIRAKKVLNGGQYWICPNCGMYVGKVGVYVNRFCFHCGQALTY